MRRAPSTRAFTAEPVAPELIHRVLDHARFAPSGGNRQGWRVIVVSDPGLRRQLRDLYLPHWTSYLEATGMAAVLAAGDASGMAAGRRRGLEAADRYARTFDQAPVHLVVCVEAAALAIVDQGLDRPSIVGGASVYPFVQNVLLGLRAEGLGAAFTTLLAPAEPEVRQLLRIPDGIILAGHISAGWRSAPWPKRLRREPVERFAFAERYGEPWPGRRLTRSLPSGVSNGSVLPGQTTWIERGSSSSWESEGPEVAAACSLLGVAGVLGVSAGPAQAAATPIVPGGAGSTCDQSTNGSNVAQLCGVSFTADAGNPGPYTVAAYQDLSACPAPYNASNPTITTNDPLGTPPNAFAGPVLGAGVGPACTGTESTEVGRTGRVTGRHAYAAPGTYTVNTTITYTGVPPNAHFCLAPEPCTRTASSRATVVGLSVTKSGPATSVAGQQMAYTLTTTNHAQTTSYGPVVVKDVLPNNVVFAGGSAGCAVSGTNANGTGGTVTCPVAASLAPGASATTTIVVVPTSSGATTNGAAVASGTALVAGGKLTKSKPSDTVTTQVAPQCTVTRTGEISGSVTVPSGTRLCLTNAHVTGSVEVEPGGALTPHQLAGGRCDRLARGDRLPGVRVERRRIGHRDRHDRTGASRPCCARATRRGSPTRARPTRRPGRAPGSAAPCRNGLTESA